MPRPRAYERYIVPGRMKVRTLRFSVIKLSPSEALVVSTSFPSNLDKSEIKFLNENFPKLLVGLFIFVVIFLLLCNNL